MKKFVALGLVISSILMMTSGCSGSNETTNTTAGETEATEETEASKVTETVEETTSAAATGEVVEINYYEWDLPNEEFIAEFNAANPDIKVIANSIPANAERSTKLDILALSGGDMDIMPIADGDQFARFESGMLASLDDYIKADSLDMEASFGDYAAWGLHEDQYYGIPFRATMTGIYYNKDMFDEAGVAYPEDDWTWEEYIETASQMAAWGEDKGIHGTYQHTYANEWATVAAQVGEWYTEDGMCNINDPAWARALETRKMLDGEGIQMSYGEIVAMKAVINSSFLGGKTAMANAGAWLVRDMKNTEKFPFDFEVGVAYLPRFDETVDGPRSNYSVSILGIPQNSNHKDEAWRFISYYVQECSDDIAASGNLPTYLPAYTEDLVEIYREGSTLDAEYARKFFNPDVKLTTNKIFGPADTTYTQTIKEEIALYFNNEKTLEEVLDTIETRVNEAIAAE